MQQPPATSYYSITTTDSLPAKLAYKRISKNGKEHDLIEHWLGQHNRKFEMLRTITGLVSATTSSLVLLRVFGAL